MAVYLATNGKKTIRIESRHEFLKPGDTLVGKKNRLLTITQKGEKKCLDTISAGIVAREFVRSALLLAEFKRQASLLK